MASNGGLKANSRLLTPTNGHGFGLQVFPPKISGFLSSNLSCCLLGPALTPLRIPVPASLLFSLPLPAPVQPLLKKASGLEKAYLLLPPPLTWAGPQGPAFQAPTPPAPCSKPAGHCVGADPLGPNHTRPAGPPGASCRPGFPALPSSAGL